MNEPDFELSNRPLRIDMCCEPLIMLDEAADDNYLTGSRGAVMHVSESRIVRSVERNNVVVRNCHRLQ